MKKKRQQKQHQNFTKWKNKIELLGNRFGMEPIIKKT